MGQAEDPFAGLTEPQRECLRLVARGFQSKEIARELGISVDGVNKRVAAAMRRLDVSSRQEAARRLAAHERQEPYQPLVGKPLAVAAAPDEADADPRSDSEGASDDEFNARAKLEQPQVPYRVGVHSNSEGGWAHGLRQLIATPERTFLVALVVGIVLALLTHS